MKWKLNVSYALNGETMLEVWIEIKRGSVQDRAGIQFTI